MKDVSFSLKIDEDELLSYSGVAKILGLTYGETLNLRRIWLEEEFPRVNNRPPITTKKMLGEWVRSRKYREVPEPWDIHTYSWWLEYLFPSVSLVVEALITVARKLAEKGMASEVMAPILPADARERLMRADEKIAEAVAEKVRLLAEVKGPYWEWPRLVLQRLEEEEFDA